MKARKIKIRIPMPPPGKPHTSKKGKKGYNRRYDKYSAIAKANRQAYAEEMQYAPKI